jgi:hypothetical protein
MAVPAAITAVGEAPWQATLFREVLHFVWPCVSKTYSTPYCLHPRNFVVYVVQIVAICVLFTTTAIS